MGGGGQIRCITGGDVEVAYGLLGSGSSILHEKHGSSHPRIVHKLHLSGVWNYPLR